MMILIVSVPVSAEATVSGSNDEIVPAYENADIAQSYLNITSNSAVCTSTCVGYPNVVSVSVKQTLQRYWGLWIWTDVDGASWSASQSGKSISVSNTQSGLSSGTYRLKSVFILTDSSGDSETITIYSDEKAVD